MWRLIRFRLAGRAWSGASIAVAAAAIAAFLVWALPSLRSPERSAALAAIVALLLSFLGQTIVSAMDKREGRLTLHSVLPLSRGQVAGQQIIEPFLAPLAFGAVGLAAALGMRAAAGGPSDSETLLFIASMTTVMLTLGQVQVFIEEVQRLTRWRRLLSVLVIVVLGASGAVFGYVLGSFAKAGEGEVPTTVSIVGDPAVAVSFLVLAVLVAGWNRQLLMRRQSYVK